MKTTKPKSIAKRSIMDHITQKKSRLLVSSHLHNTDALPTTTKPHHKTIRLSLLLRNILSGSISHQQNDISTSSSSLSCRLNETKISDEEMVHKNKNKSSPIGTAADHRMTNNNRICKQPWSTSTGAVVILSLIFYISLVGLTVVSGHPDPEPVRVSHYSKSARSDNPFKPLAPPTSPTLRSTTVITSFLPSDAIPSTAPMLKSHNGWIPSGGSSSRNVSNIGAISKNDNNNSNNSSSNAHSPIKSSRRSASARKRESSFETVQTSIDRPFYTKITSEDAVTKPGYYSRHRTPSATSTKKGKKSKGTSSKSSKHSKTKKGASEEELEGIAAGGPTDENVFIPHTTEKAYRPPKLSLEPFFNFLTSLASASREVMLSKEQQQQQQHQQLQQNNNLPEYSNDGAGSKYSGSYYDTVNESIRESAKKTKKSKKGKGKKKSKGHSHYHHHHKSSKKGSKGSTTKRYKLKSEESLEEEEEEEFDPLQEIQQPPQTSPGPIPIPLPNPIIDQAELEENDNPEPEGLHILDVLRTPMIPDYESPLPSPPRAEPLIDYHENNNHQNSLPPTNTSSSAASQFTGNPPSGRSNLNNKGQGYHLPSEKGEGINASGNGGAAHTKQRDKQRSERGDPMDSFLDQHNVDLQAQESISHTSQVVVPSPYGMKNNVGGGGGLASSHQFHLQHHQQQPKGNDPSAAASQQQPTQTNSPEFGKTGGEGTSAFGQDDAVSKYPMTFVYQNNGLPPPPGSPPPASRTPYMSPLGIPPNALYGPPPSGRPPFRMSKLRPNLHSYYDPNYHRYAGMGEHQVASEMIGIRHPYGPPHFKPLPPHAMLTSSGNNNMSPLPSPPRFGNGYGNRPGYMMMPHHRGSHYVGHTLSGAPGSSHERITNKPYDDNGGGSGASADYQLDQTGNENGDTSLMMDMSGSDGTGGSVSDPIDQFGSGPGDLGNSVSTTGAENSETKKIGIMDSFDLFYKEYKLLTWVAVFFVTSMALLTLLVYLYINNPPTEVVQARVLPWSNLLKNPQITKFLSSLVEFGSSKGGSVFLPDKNFKPYGKGLGTQSGKQKRKQTRAQIDREKMLRRLNKTRRRTGSISNSQPSSQPVKFPGDKPTQNLSS